MTISSVVSLRKKVTIYRYSVLSFGTFEDQPNYKASSPQQMTENREEVGRTFDQLNMKREKILIENE
jgi:hypothetical protein